jgi:serine/threonine-protein kinase
LARGVVIDGRYRLEEVLSEGGMGSVWRAEHCTLYTPVAMKFMGEAFLTDETARARFVTEARAAAALKSTHIAHVYDFGLQGGSPFIAMELLIGESLSTRLERGPLSLEATATLLIEMARGMRYAHRQGVVHRDLKPENIFLAQENDLEVTKILDFGVARVRSYATGIQAVQVGVENSLIGTPSYISPEQALSGHSVDHSTDLWAMAVIVYECLTGRRPFESLELSELLSMICLSPFASLNDAVSVDGTPLNEFAPWFRKALAKDPQDRFQSAEEMADSFYPLVYGSPRPLTVAPPSMNGGSQSNRPDLTSQGSSALKKLTSNSWSSVSSLASSFARSLSNAWEEFWHFILLKAESSKPFRYVVFSVALLSGMLLAMFFFDAKAKESASSPTVTEVGAPAASVLDLDKGKTEKPDKIEATEPPVPKRDPSVLSLEDLDRDSR